MIEYQATIFNVGLTKTDDIKVYHFKDEILYVDKKELCRILNFDFNKLSNLLKKSYLDGANLANRVHILKGNFEGEDNTELYLVDFRFIPLILSEIGNAKCLDILYSLSTSSLISVSQEIIEHINLQPENKPTVHTNKYGEPIGSPDYIPDEEFELGYFDIRDYQED